MDSKNFKKIKIGILDPSSFLEVSASVKRALRMTEDALKKLGYDVVPVKFDQKIFDTARKSTMGVFANDLYHGVLRDFKIVGEPMLRPLKANELILESTGIKRYIIDSLLKLFNKGRTYTFMKWARVRNPYDYELFVKSRYEFVDEVAQLW